jgi:hypothetical protein
MIEPWYSGVPNLHVDGCIQPPNAEKNNFGFQQ